MVTKVGSASNWSADRPARPGIEWGKCGVSSGVRTAAWWGSVRASDSFLVWGHSDPLGRFAGIVLMKGWEARRGGTVELTLIRCSIGVSRTTVACEVSGSIRAI